MLLLLLLLLLTSDWAAAAITAGSTAPPTSTSTTGQTPTTTDHSHARFSPTAHFELRPPSSLHSLPLSFFPSLIQHPSFNTTPSTLITVDHLIPSFNTSLGDVHSATPNTILPPSKTRDLRTLFLPTREPSSSRTGLQPPNNTPTTHP